MFDKDEFRCFLEFLYLKAVSVEYAGELAIVSPEIRKVIDSLDDRKYYRYPFERTMLTICNLLEENDLSYEGLRNVFRSKETKSFKKITDRNYVQSFYDGLFSEVSNVWFAQTWYV